MKFLCFALKSRSRCIVANEAFLDELIQGSAKNWKTDRMPVMDRCILRIGCAEMRFEGTPPAVAIDEAVEMASIYSTVESGAFVNGVLDKLHVGRTS